VAKVRAYTDGACSGNPGPGGWAALLLFNENEKQEISGYSEDTTNNHMELKAVIEAIKLAVSLGYKDVDIYSDAAYVVNPFKNQWYKRWELNSWKTAKGSDVKNKDLWIKFSKLVRKYRGINLIKIKGHSGHEHNDRVDMLAKKEIERMR